MRFGSTNHTLSEMRILIVTDQFPPQIFGGMAQHAWHIALQLSAQHAVRVLLPWRQKADWGDLPFEVSPTLSRRFPVLDRMSILWHAWTFKPDVIHVCNAALSYRLVSRYYPMVTRVVGNDFLRPWCGYRLPLRGLLYRIPAEGIKVLLKEFETFVRRRKTLKRLSRASAVVANSKWTETRLLEVGMPEGIVSTVVGGVDTSLFKPSSNRQQMRRALGFNETDQVVVTAANLFVTKRIDKVLNVVARLAPAWPNLQYVILGDGPYEKELKDLAVDLGIADRVDFAGRKNQTELCRYYQAADIYVQVSAETMGRAYIEAGACGVPVVATRERGVTSIVEQGKNGLLVPDPSNIDAIVAAVDQLLADTDLRHRLGETGMRMARERFSWGAVTVAFEEILMKSAGCASVDK